jgi:predicted PurR-regulated permease PerM
VNSRTLLGIVALVVLGLLAWELRWVLLVLFGAIVLAVALDVPISLLRRLLPLNRGASLVIVVVSVVVVGGLLSQLLLPELVDQIQELTNLIPMVYQRLIVLAGQLPGLPDLENQLLQPGTLERLQPVGTQILGLAGGAAS